MTSRSIRKSAISRSCPWDPIEQHGPHCPSGDDSYNAIRMAEMIAKKTGVMLLPCPWYGAHPYHHWDFPGTIPLRNRNPYGPHQGYRPEGLRRRAITSSSFSHAMAKSLPRPVRFTNSDWRATFVLSLHWYEFVRDIHNDIFQTPFWHADETETSVALYLYPEYVDMTKAAKEKPEPLIDPKFIGSPGGKLGNLSVLLL